MKDLYHSFNAAVSELIWFLILQGLFFFFFAVVTLFYPYFLVIIVAFFLICSAVLSIYFGIKVWSIKRKVDKFITTKRF